MNFLVILKKTAMAIQQKKDSLFNYDVDKQKRYLLTLKEPIDDIERSFNQYKCQMKLNGFLLTALINITSIFFIFIYLIKFRINDSHDLEGNVDAVFLPDGKPGNILPIELLDEYQNIKYENDKNNYFLSNNDKKFLLKLIRKRPFSWHFIFKCMMKIARYRVIIDTYSPEAIIVCAEYSFTSSVLTAYCEDNNIKHINVMHGEKLFYMRDSFFRFHRFYIWDEYYKNLFLQLRAEPEQFIVSVPKSLKFDLNESIKKEVDFTYYLAGESKEELMAIGNSLKKLSAKGFTIAIRPHPRYTDIMQVESIFNDIEIEYYNNTSIEVSVLRTQNAISLYSTVLNQAFQNGTNIVVDDITNTLKFDKLLELQYIILNKEHLLLSELIGG